MTRAGSGRRVATAVAMGLREFRRTPVLLALLVVLPAYVIGAFVLVVPDTEVALPVDGGTTAVAMPAFAAAYLTPLTVAILSGIVGLFLVRTSRAADGRLRLAGFGATELVVSRVGILAAGTAVVTATSAAVALLALDPESTAGFLLATVLVGSTYGIIGVIVGLVLDELAGVYVLLFAPMVDVLMFQNPLATGSPAWTTALPSHFATRAIFDAAFTGRIEAVDLAAASAYAGALLVVGAVVFYRATRVD